MKLCPNIFLENFKDFLSRVENISADAEDLVGPYKCLWWRLWEIFSLFDDRSSKNFGELIDIMDIFHMCLKKLSPEKVAEEEGELKSALVEFWNIIQHSLTEENNRSSLLYYNLEHISKLTVKTSPEKLEIHYGRLQEAIEKMRHIPSEDKQALLSMVRELCGRYQEKITGSKSPHKRKCESSDDDQTSEKRQRESENDSETSEKRQRESENDSETSQKRQRESSYHSE